MTDRMIKKDQFMGFLHKLKNDYNVFIPVKEDDTFYNFEALGEKETFDFDYKNTRLSPKSFALPQSEKMFEFSLSKADKDANILREAASDSSNTVIVGIRPCDANAFKVINANFDNPEFRDPWWTKHRDSLTLIGLGCNEPDSTCFCTSAGGGPFDEKGLDILLFDLEEYVLIRPITEKGGKLVEAADINQEADSSLKQKADEIKAASEKKITSHVSTDKLKSKNLMDLFNAPFWDNVAFACINCGTCTFLCPTCWCFDIQDEVNYDQGDRIRNWDSCMFPLFTLHASGHNPRSEKVQRVRQRFMHKLKYYVDKYDNGIACVGCGRCVKYCPVNIDIREVIRLMNE